MQAAVSVEIGLGTQASPCRGNANIVESLPLEPMLGVTVFLSWQHLAGGLNPIQRA